MTPARPAAATPSRPASASVARLNAAVRSNPQPALGVVAYWLSRGV